jgi:molecular chaperone HscB
LKDVNAFQLFHLDQRYFIDTNALDMQYKSVQKRLHPDMFVNKPNDERDASNETSSTVNQAYQVCFVG